MRRWRHASKRIGAIETRAGASSKSLLRSPQRCGRRLARDPGHRRLPDAVAQQLLCGKDGGASGAKLEALLRCARGARRGVHLDLERGGIRDHSGERALRGASAMRPARSTNDSPRSAIAWCSWWRDCHSRSKAVSLRPRLRARLDEPSPKAHPAHRRCPAGRASWSASHSIGRPQAGTPRLTASDIVLHDDSGRDVRLPTPRSAS